jgi:hypothetical protein
LAMRCRWSSRSSAFTGLLGNDVGGRSAAFAPASGNERTLVGVAATGERMVLGDLTRE